jgi:hypothetical protein
MLAIILTYLVLILEKSTKERFIIFLLGVSHGELLYGYLMEYFLFPLKIGSLSFFDITAIGLLFISIWCGLETVSSYLNHSTSKSSKRKAGIL